MSVISKYAYAEAHQEWLEYVKTALNDERETDSNTSRARISLHNERWMNCVPSINVSWKCKQSCKNTAPACVW
jgi:hypothetical protein